MYYQTTSKGIILITSEYVARFSYWCVQNIENVVMCSKRCVFDTLNICIEKSTQIRQLDLLHVQRIPQYDYHCLDVSLNNTTFWTFETELPAVTFKHSPVKLLTERYFRAEFTARADRFVIALVAEKVCNITIKQLF